MVDPPSRQNVESSPPRRAAAEMINLMDRAAMLTRQEPLRRGNVVCLPPKGDLVVLGDLHGNTDNLRKVVEWAALSLHRDRYLVLQELVHGGPLDSRGRDHSFRLLEEAAELKCRFGSQVQMVLSNHDLAELTGSTITKGSHNVSSAFWRGLADAYGEGWPEVHGAYQRLLSALPLAVRTPSGVFISHSTPQRDTLDLLDYTIFDRPLTAEDYLPGGSAYALVWGRFQDQEVADTFAKRVGAEVLVTGHQASAPGVKAPTSRHIILVSDRHSGRFLHIRLDTTVPFNVLLRQVTRISSLGENATDLESEI